jgi:uncharacterized protein (TIGR03000 family)
MNRTTLSVLFAVSVVVASASRVEAWGRGGGARGGGGYRAAAGGSYRAAAGGGYRAATGGGYRAAATGGYRAAATGGYRGAAVAGSGRAAVAGTRGAAVGTARAGAVRATGAHVGVATDFGFGRAAGARGTGAYVHAGYRTRAYSPAVLAARGTAVRGGFYQYRAFNGNWWAGHPGAWRPYGWNVGRFWGWATWPALTGWFGWSAEPVYYDYGTSIVYQGDQVYINDQPGPTAADYYQQAETLALSAPAVPPTKKEDEWQPLGVFSLVQGEQSDTSAVFQLAVNKAGVIGGNYYNVFTDTTLPVRGSVDPKTQRASWIVGDQKTTIYDTGIYNLTKEQAPVLIHFGKDRTQQWLLVRIEEKDTEAPEGAKDVVSRPPAAEEVARIRVIVPDDAQVFFDGTLTTQTGAQREFVSPPLVPGSRYTYSLRARWTADGRPVEQTRTVPVRAGAKVLVDFTSPLP